MKRLARRLFMLLSAVSLLLCVAVCVLWVRSYWVSESLEFVRPTRGAGVEVAKGRLRAFVATLSYPDDVSRLAAERHLDRQREFRGLGALRYRRAGRADSGYRLPPGAGKFGIEFRSYTCINHHQGKGRGHSVAAPHPALATALFLLAFPRWLLGLLSRPKPRGLCPTCGYDLRATPDRCPECGTATAEASPAAPPG